MMGKGFLMGMTPDTVPPGTVPKAVAVIIRFWNQTGWKVKNRMESEESKVRMILETI